MYLSGLADIRVRLEGIEKFYAAGEYHAAEVQLGLRAIEEQISAGMDSPAREIVTTVDRHFRRFKQLRVDQKTNALKELRAAIAAMEIS